jgi:CheY-like chemotaxis protein
MNKVVDSIHQGIIPKLNKLPNPEVKELNSLSVLFIDDDFVNYTYYRELIKETASNIFRAVSLKQALQMLTDNKCISLIIMSASLPENFNNFALRNIKSRFPAIPIITSLNSYSRYMEADLLKAGSNGCISRYIDREHLIEVFKDAL